MEETSSSGLQKNLNIQTGKTSVSVYSEWIQEGNSGSCSCRSEVIERESVYLNKDSQSQQSSKDCCDLQREGIQKILLDEISKSKISYFKSINSDFKTTFCTHSQL